MNFFKKVVLGVTIAAAIGCGGGGGGGGSASSGSAAIFITDDLSTNYDHVWATIKQVSLGKVGGGSSVVFSDTAGLTVDLRSLRDNLGRKFKFISHDDSLSGQYDSVTVTLDDDVVLFPTAATTGQPRTFEGAVGGEKTLSANFAARAFGSGNDDSLLTSIFPNGTRMERWLLAPSSTPLPLTTTSRTTTATSERTIQA